MAALMRELRVLRRPHRDVIALQSQYVVALGHFAKFLAAEGAEAEALKIVGLADAIGQLRNGPRCRCAEARTVRQRPRS